MAFSTQKKAYQYTFNSPAFNKMGYYDGFNILKIKDVLLGIDELVAVVYIAEREAQSILGCNTAVRHINDTNYLRVRLDGIPVYINALRRGELVRQISTLATEVIAIASGSAVLIVSVADGVNMELRLFDVEQHLTTALPEVHTVSAIEGVSPSKYWDNAVAWRIVLGARRHFLVAAAFDDDMEVVWGVDAIVHDCRKDYVDIALLLPPNDSEMVVERLAIPDIGCSYAVFERAVGRIVPAGMDEHGDVVYRYASTSLMLAAYKQYVDEGCMRSPIDVVEQLMEV